MNINDALNFLLGVALCVDLYQFRFEVLLATVYVHCWPVRFLQQHHPSISL